jgi:hypothetical protein
METTHDQNSSLEGRVKNSRIKSTLSKIPLIVIEGSYTLGVVSLLNSVHNRNPDVAKAISSLYLIGGFAGSCLIYKGYNWAANRISRFLDRNIRDF